MGTKPQLVPELAERLSVLSDMDSWKAPVGPAEDVAVDVWEYAFAGPNGPVPTRIYTPRTSAPASGRPALIWMHGGAFCWGDLDMPEADQVARGIAARADAVVISVDYRLCGVDEVANQFPVPQDDCQAVYDDVVRNPARFGIDPARVSVGGASAGASLASTITIRSTRAGYPPQQTFLIYPLVHNPIPVPEGELAETLATAPAGLQFPPELMGIVEKAIGLKDDDPNLADYNPGGTDRVRWFGPTYVENAEFDMFRASGEAFADELRAAGVPVIEKLRPGVPHGHLDWQGLPAAYDTLDEMAALIRNGFPT